MSEPTIVSPRIDSGAHRCARGYDSEYKRNGTVNLFVIVDVHQPWRHVKVTDQRTGQDFAACMRDLVDQHYPQAQKIRVVLDNLSTHSAASLYNSFVLAPLASWFAGIKRRRRDWWLSCT